MDVGVTGKELQWRPEKKAVSQRPAQQVFGPQYLLSVYSYSESLLRSILGCLGLVLITNKWP